MQYRLKYVEHRSPKSPALTPALALGTSLHASLAEWHGPGLTRPVAAEELLARHWQGAGYASMAESDSHFALGLSVLNRYMRADVHHQGQVLGTEVYLARVVVAGSLRMELACRADRITLLPDETLEVLDYKTTADGLVPLRDELAADLPTFVYYLLARVMYPQHPRVTVAQLNLFTLNKATVDYSETERAHSKAELLAAAAAIENETFEPRLGAHCAWCPVRESCPAFGPEVTLDSM
jgi:RecB family exonuclease